MLKTLQCDNFRFISEPDKFHLLAVDVDGDTGFLLEVDLNYSPELHTLHNDFLLHLNI